MGDAAKDYLSRYVSPTLLTGLTELSKKKPLDPFVSVFIDKVFKSHSDRFGITRGQINNDRIAILEVFL